MQSSTYFFQMTETHLFWKLAITSNEMVMHTVNGINPKCLHSIFCKIQANLMTFSEDVLNELVLNVKWCDFKLLVSVVHYNQTVVNKIVQVGRRCFSSEARKKSQYSATNPLRLKVSKLGYWAARDRRKSLTLEVFRRSWSSWRQSSYIEVWYRMEVKFRHRRFSSSVLVIVVVSQFVGEDCWPFLVCWQLLRDIYLSSLWLRIFPFLLFS